MRSAMESSDRKTCKRYAEHSPSITTGSNAWIERLALAEIDEVIWRRLHHVELDQILQPVSGDGGGDTAVERAEVFRFALPLLAIEVYQPARRFGDAPRRNL